MIIFFNYLQLNHCSTEAPMYIDTPDFELPANPGEVATSEVCVHVGSNCCYQRIPDRKVKNCGNYYVYWLRGTSGCARAYCTEPKPAELEEKPEPETNTQITSGNTALTSGSTYDTCADPCEYSTQKYIDQEPFR